MRIFISRNPEGVNDGSVALWSERPQMLPDDDHGQLVWDDGKDMETFLGALNPSRTGFDEVADGLQPLLSELLAAALRVDYGKVEEVLVEPVIATLIRET